MLLVVDSVVAERVESKDLEQVVSSFIIVLFSLFVSRGMLVWTVITLALLFNLLECVKDCVVVLGRFCSCSYKLSFSEFIFLFSKKLLESDLMFSVDSVYD